MNKLACVAFLAFTTALSAQNCGALAVTGTGAPGTPLTFAVTGTTPHGFVFLAIAENTGTTTIPLGQSSLTLGLAMPVVPVPLGPASAAGDRSRTLNVPNGIPQQISLNAQAVTLSFSWMPFSLSACATNVAAFTIG